MTQKKAAVKKSGAGSRSRTGNKTRAEQDAILALVIDAMSLPFGGGFGSGARTERPLPLAEPPVTPMQFRIRVDLVGATPPLWRRLTLPSNLTLDRVNEVLQVAFGWTDSHLHRFSLEFGRTMPRMQKILSPFDVADGADGVPETELRLDQVLGKKDDKLRYTYDFGDGWEHLLKLEAIEPRQATDASVRAIAGRRHGAPEDVGGIYSYDNLLAAAADPEHPDLEDLEELIDELGLRDFDDRIDLDRINLGL
ncbi:MAG: plasmid pRiA4b ORF-3 family protein [Ramlibacter sp.]|nr:plasmid pRiA4b ORF-3 family protein [Cryobacterium sp.]